MHSGHVWKSYFADSFRQNQTLQQNIAAFTDFYHSSKINGIVQNMKDDNELVIQQKNRMLQEFELNLATNPEIQQKEPN